MNTEQVESFIKLQPQIQSAYEEISLLSKKKPDDPLNKFKLRFINGMLSIANTLLGDSGKPFPDSFDQFDEDDMPTNSDVVFVLSNYIECLETLRCDNIQQETPFPHKWYWIVSGKRSSIETPRATLK
jgi:hypothetical protein